jgi:hypothetical protein
MVSRVLRRPSGRALALVGVLSAARLAAQQSPFLDEAVFRALVNELSGDIAFEHLRYFTQFHRPMGGSEGFEAVARYVEQKAREYGLEAVRYIPLASDTPSWTPKLGELWLIAPEERRLAFTPEVALSLADYSRSVDIPSAELVDVGDGTSEADYAGRDVRGKVVLASGPVARVMEEAVWNRGALGLVWFTTTSRVPDYPDQVPWTRIPVANQDKTQHGTFAFVLSHREGMRLRRQMAEAKDLVFRVRARVVSAFHEPASQAIVEALIPGTEIPDQDIVLTAHLQEERFSANDDASGCANVLEIARALTKLIAEGRLPRPRRDIRFWWVDEISAEEQYFADHPEERRQLLANLNQDMVGAKQSVGSRVQFVTRPPFSRASFLGDVVESIVEALVDGNTAFLAAGQARQVRRGVAQPSASSGEDVPFSRPILSRLGTKERYDARVIPFHNNTDHQVFNLGIIGVPAVTFTNWPDEFIHSSDDDLWQMDPTQLKRNAVAVAAAAYYLAQATDRDVAVLATEVYGRAEQRLARDGRRAMEMLAAAPPAERASRYGRAANLVREAARRERRALESVRAFTTPNGSGARLLDGLLKHLPTAEEVERRLQSYYRTLTGQPPPPAALTAREHALAARVPAYVDSVKAFLAGRARLRRPPSLHPLMAYEALNFVDGTRSYLDIYRAVLAEADAAGEWYYGAVTLEDVASYLDSAERAGMLIVNTRLVTDGR